MWISPLLCRTDGLCHPERSRLYLNERIKRGFVEPKAKSGSTSKTFYNTLTDRPFDYAQGDRDIMNREANIAVKVLADTNNSVKARIEGEVNPLLV